MWIVNEDYLTVCQKCYTLLTDDDISYNEGLPEGLVIYDIETYCSDPICSECGYTNKSDDQLYLPNSFCDVKNVHQSFVHNGLSLIKIPPAKIVGYCDLDASAIKNLEDILDEIHDKIVDNVPDSFKQVLEPYIDQPIYYAAFSFIYNGKLYYAYATGD